MTELESSPLFEEIKKIFPTEDERTVLKKMENEILEGFRKGVVVGAEAGQKKFDEKQAGSTLAESADETSD